ncbi:MAG TPA: conjugative transposon protein TraK, partial [Chryseobacterium indologenes]|nr:conjugative transposon protein TraK [Chryseobacterium indologenes]
MLIKNIEQRIKINKIVSLSAIVFAVFIVIAGFFFSYRMIQDSRRSIYVLDNGVPVLAKQTDVLLNRPVEYKA